MPYLTPNLSTDNTVLVLIVPSGLEPACFGALAQLTKPEIWEEEGQMMPQWCADAIQDALYFLSEEYGVMLTDADGAYLTDPCGAFLTLAS